MTDPLETRQCRICGEWLPETRFSINRKAGKEYRNRRCNDCRSLEYQRFQESQRNRAVGALLRWPPVLIDES